MLLWQVILLCCSIGQVLASSNEVSDLLGTTSNPRPKQNDPSPPTTYYEAPPTDEEKKAALGRASWTLLHTMAAKYDPANEEKVRTFLYLFADLYPCEVCAEHFREKLAKSPPKLKSNAEFVQWMCELHNSVNKDLKKPVFDCSRVGDRWDCGCRLNIAAAAPQ